MATNHAYQIELCIAALRSVELAGAAYASSVAGQQLVEPNLQALRRSGGMLGTNVAIAIRAALSKRALPDPYADRD